MATVTDKRKVLGNKGKLKVIQQTENGKKKADMLGIGSHKLYISKNLEKQNQNY